MNEDEHSPEVDEKEGGKTMEHGGVKLRSNPAETTKTNFPNHQKA
jgi:hypothetical protein